MAGPEANSPQKHDYQDLSGWRGNGGTLAELKMKLLGQPATEVRIYTVKTTRLEKGSMAVRHFGSGPNLEGGLATLCTCKHSMRQNHEIDKWKGLWILGLTSRAKANGFNGKHYLLYMMKIDRAFDSHMELYKYLALNNKPALRIKNATNNNLGDIFEPRPECLDKDPLKFDTYKNPHLDHSHGLNDGWHDDISYGQKKSTPLLVGEKKLTFVWPTPMISFKGKRGVGNLKRVLEPALLDELFEDN
jgi:hypothetical protein